MPSRARTGEWRPLGRGGPLHAAERAAHTFSCSETALAYNGSCFSPPLMSKVTRRRGEDRIPLSPRGEAKSGSLCLEQWNASLIGCIAQLAVEHGEMESRAPAEDLECRLDCGEMDAIVTSQAVAAGEISGATE